MFRGERIDGYTPDRVAAAGISRTDQNIRLFRNITAIENQGNRAKEHQTKRQAPTPSDSH